MPLKGNVKYRYRKISGGRKQRLAIRKGKVIEVKTGKGKAKKVN